MQLVYLPETGEVMSADALAATAAVPATRPTTALFGAAFGPVTVVTNANDVATGTLKFRR